MLGADLAAKGGTGTNDLFNAGEALVKGIEFSTSINTINLSSKFKLPIYFNYTFTDAKFSDDFESSFDPWGGDIRTGYYLPYISKHLDAIIINYSVMQKIILLQTMIFGTSRSR